MDLIGVPKTGASAYLLASSMLFGGKGGRCEGWAVKGNMCKEKFGMYFPEATSRMPLSELLDKEPKSGRLEWRDN